MKNGPELWDTILKTMPDDAFIAGGAVRDYFLGLEPKDFDVFCGHEHAEAIRNLGFNSIEDDSESADEYATANGVDWVLRKDNIDVIGMNDADPEKVIASFDFGIARSYYKNGEIVDKQEALLDRLFKTVTMYKDDRKERSERRFARFNERAGGDWTLRYPEKKS